MAMTARSGASPAFMNSASMNSTGRITAGMRGFQGEEVHWQGVAGWASKVSAYVLAATIEPPVLRAVRQLAVDVYLGHHRLDHRVEQAPLSGT